MQRTEPTPERYQAYRKIVDDIDAKLAKISQDTDLLSSHSYMREHADFLALVEMGDRIVPYIFNRMISHGSCWVHLILLGTTIDGCQSEYRMESQSRIIEMTIYSGRTTLHKHKGKNWQDYPLDGTETPGVRKVFMLDAQWSTCPVEVEEQVKGLWRAYELENDHGMLKRTIDDLLEMHEDGGCPTDRIIQYLRENNVPDDELVIIHWWW